MEQYLGLFLFAGFMVGTPGPANLLVMLGGMQYGVRGCLAFIAALIVGKALVNALVGAGFGLFLSENETARWGLTLAGGGYMIWLAAQSWGGAGRRQTDAPARFSFAKGAVVHPLNPKAWLMCVLAWGNFAPQSDSLAAQMAVVVGAFAFAQVIAHTGWCAAGQLLGAAFRGNILLARALTLLTIAVIVGAILWNPGG